MFLQITMEEIEMKYHIFFVSSILCQLIVFMYICVFM